MTSAPVIHVLDRVNYSKHRLVTLTSQPLPPLAPSSLRLRSRIIGLTTNNFSYARLGHLLGWWDIYPQPINTPAPYNDQSSYGCIAAWGYAEILESTVSDIPAGISVFGFIRIGTLPFDISIEATGLKNQIFVTSPHRQHLWKIYNRYRIEPPLNKLIDEKSLDSLGWDTYAGLFATSYNLNRYGFAWTYTGLIHPSGHGEWSTENANLDNAAVIILNASGKTGMAFAYVLRHARPKEHRPRSIIGVCSLTSKSTVNECSDYDNVMHYSDHEDAAKTMVEQIGKPRRVVICDFGARAGVFAAWNSTFYRTGIPTASIAIGKEVKPEHPDDSRERMMKEMESGDVRVNAGELLEKGITTEGDSYFPTFLEAFDDFKKKGAYPGTELMWSDGMGEWEKSWELLCSDRIAPDVGLLFRL